MFRSPETLEQLTCEQYRRPCRALSNATVGQHVRHIIELFICLENGYYTGIVNYDKRKRDLSIETDRVFASSLLKSIYLQLDKKNKNLVLQASYDDLASESFSIETNYYREVVYNLEHTVHHMALIRVGLLEVSAVQVPESFGVASSTRKYREVSVR